MGSAGRRPLRRSFGTAFLAACGAACGSGASSSPPSPSHATTTTEDLCTGRASHVSGRVVDANNAPIAGALVAVERGGLYVLNKDPSAANPAYAWGAVADAVGRFDFACPCGTVVGIHAYAPGHKYNTLGMPITITADTDVGPIQVQDLHGQIEPTIADLTATPSVVAPGGSVTFSMTAAAAPPSTSDDAGTGDGGARVDPLSDEVLCLEPRTDWGAAMTPPGPGKQSTGFPNGTWTRTITAPSAPGTYTYFFVATTEACITSEPAMAMLTVQ